MRIQIKKTYRMKLLNLYLLVYSKKLQCKNVPYFLKLHVTAMISTTFGYSRTRNDGKMNNFIFNYRESCTLFGCNGSFNGISMVSSR